MYIERMVIDDFLTIGHADLLLANRGLVLIQGENKDDTSAESNGAGKSSLTDAIKWCWFGTTARGESGDKVVNRTAGKGTRVVTYVADGDDRYKIIRHRKHKEGKNSLQVFQFKSVAEEPIDLTKGTDALTQEVVNRIVGCSEEVFDAAVYAGQEKMPDLPGMTDKALKLLIEEAAGITVLERAYSIARTRLQKANADVDAAVSKCESLGRLITNLNNQTDDLNLRHEDWKISQKNKIEEAKAKVVVHSEKAKSIRDAALKLGDEAEIKAGIAECLRKIQAIKPEEEELSRRKDEIGKLEREVSAITAVMATLAKNARDQKTVIDGIQGRVGKPCDECGKKIAEEDLAETKRLATERLKGIVQQHSDKKSALADVQNTLAGLTESLEAFVKGMTDIHATNALYGRLNELGRDIDRLKSESNQQVELARLSAKQASTLESDVNPYDEMIANIKANIADTSQELDHAKLVLENAKSRLELADAAVKVYGPAGVRAHILDNVTPFLNNRTAHYLGTLSDGNISAIWSTLSKTAKGELREKFCIEVNNVTGSETFKGLSGGEKRKVRLATTLALQDLVASRATKPISVWIGDEIDYALDPTGLERLMSILEEKARERGTVLVISHQSLRDWIRNTATVVKEGGKSEVKGVLCNE